MSKGILQTAWDYYTSQDDSNIVLIDENTIQVIEEGKEIIYKRGSNRLGEEREIIQF